MVVHVSCLAKYWCRQTWIVAVSPSSLMFSPIRLSAPTRTNSCIAAPDMLSAMTTGPDTLRTYLHKQSFRLRHSYVCCMHSYNNVWTQRDEEEVTSALFTNPDRFSEVLGSLAMAQATKIDSQRSRSTVAGSSERVLPHATQRSLLL